MKETKRQKSVRKKNLLDSIPVDLLMDIFSRGDGKSIARFRCVSKSWGYILRRPDFTELFLTKSYTRPRLFFTLRVSSGKLWFYSSPQPQNPKKNSTLVATRYHTSFPEYFPYDKCSTVCGLVLLQRDSKRKMLVICNPITGEFLTLPRVLLKDKTSPEVKGKSKQPDREPKETIERILFGYDPISKQFKVLCMTSSHCGRPNTHQVLTLESGKRLWRRIGCKFHYRETYRMNGEICINGVLYFGTAFRKSCVIVCFDVRSEKFSFIKMNKDILGKYSYLTLFNYKGRLGIRKETNWDRELVLWVLEDAGSHKWSKHLYKFPRLSTKRFVGMIGTGEIVLSKFNHRSKLLCVYLYNLERKTITRVKIQGFEEFKYPNTFNTFLDYVENLKLI